MCGLRVIIILKKLLDIKHHHSRLKYIANRPNVTKVHYIIIKFYILIDSLL